MDAPNLPGKDRSDPCRLVNEVRSLPDHESSQARVELARVRERMKEQNMKDLRSLYRSNPKVRTFCGMIAALALLPENEVRLGLENLKEVADGMCLLLE